MFLESFGHEDAASAAGPTLTESLAQIVSNRTIASFLKNDNKCYVVGPKGTGKTLLLLKKALGRVHDSSVLLIPSDAQLPVDRFTGQQHLGERFWRRHRGGRDESLVWSAVWLHAILKSVLYNVCDTAGRLTVALRSWAAVPKHARSDYAEVARRSLESDLSALLGSPPYTRRKAVFHFYAELLGRLDAAGARGIDGVREENRKLKEIVGELAVPVYIFMDNLDAFYELHPELWLTSIYGQFRIIREIRLDFRNIHVFTSVRKDIYNRFRTEEIVKYNDYIAFLDYKRSEVLKVFELAIERLDEELLAEPALRSENPWQAFFGDAVEVTNLLVSRRSESIQDYVFRHSLWRPRDLVTIGNHILSVKGDEPIDEAVVRRAVDNAAAVICAQYLEEIEPSLPQGMNSVTVQELVAEFLPSNVLTYDQVREACRRYNASCGHVCEENCYECLNMHPFCAMYAAGLVGYVNLSAVTGEREQSFLKPGESHALEHMQRVPRAKHYVLHPILNNLLGNDRIHPRLVVGYGLPFNEALV